MNNLTVSEEKVRNHIEKTKKLISDYQSQIDYLNGEVDFYTLLLKKMPSIASESEDSQEKHHSLSSSPVPLTSRLSVRELILGVLSNEGKNIASKQIFSSIISIKPGISKDGFSVQLSKLIKEGVVKKHEEGKTHKFKYGMD